MTVNLLGKANFDQNQLQVAFIVNSDMTHLETFSLEYMLNSFTVLFFRPLLHMADFGCLMSHVALF